MMQLPSALVILPIVLGSLFLRAEAATEFSAPLGSAIVCSDSLNRNGQVDLDSGSNFNIGQATQADGVWTVTGGYTIRFPIDCDHVQCQGDCMCKDCTSTTDVADCIIVEDNTNSTTTAATNNQIGDSPIGSWVETFPALSGPVGSMFGASVHVDAMLISRCQFCFDLTHAISAAMMVAAAMVAEWLVGHFRC